MKFLKISKLVLILTLPFLLFLLVLNFVGFDNFFYKQKFLEYKVQEDVSNPMPLHEKVINFIKGKNNELPNEFNEREKQHLWDVRKIMNMFKLVLYIFIILFVILLIVSSFILKVNNKIINFISKVLIFGGFLTIILAIMLFLSINYNFLSTFETLHSLFFEKGTYVFDPAKEIIVKLYPEQLFMELGIKISKWVLIISVIIILLGAFLIVKSKKQKK